jgi:hypothetical protein
MSGFRRLVLELGHDAADRGTMREAAGFARLLDAELHALFVEDETLLHASALPFAREINPLSLRWRKMETERLEVELTAAAEQARGRLMAVATAVGIRLNFEIRRGDPAMRVTELSVATDVVVVAPQRRVETAHAVGRLRETADRPVASVLYLPPMGGRRVGPVVAVVLGDGDPALAVARAIAARGDAALVVERVVEGTTPSDISAALGDMRERLIVMTRDGGSGPELAAMRGAAVLVVEPRGSADRVSAQAQP